jgi:hypothetical protein
MSNVLPTSLSLHILNVYQQKRQIVWLIAFRRGIILVKGYLWFQLIFAVDPAAMIRLLSFIARQP